MAKTISFTTQAEKDAAILAKQDAYSAVVAEATEAAVVAKTAFDTCIAELSSATVTG